MALDAMIERVAPGSRRRGEILRGPERGVSFVGLPYPLFLPRSKAPLRPGVDIEARHDSALLREQKYWETFWPKPSPSTCEVEGGEVVFRFERSLVVPSDQELGVMLSNMGALRNVFGGNVYGEDFFSEHCGPRLAVKNPQNPFDWAKICAEEALALGLDEFFEGLSSGFLFPTSAIFSPIETLATHAANPYPLGRETPLRVPLNAELQGLLDRKDPFTPEALYFAAKFPNTPEKLLVRVNVLVQKGCMIERLVEVCEQYPDELNFWIEIAEKIYLKHDSSKYCLPWWFKKDIDFRSFAGEHDKEVLRLCAHRCGPAFAYALSTYSQGGAVFFELTCTSPDALWKDFSAIIFTHAIGNPQRGVRVLHYIKKMVEEVPAERQYVLLQKLIRHASNRGPVHEIIGALEGENAGLVFPGLAGVHSVVGDREMAQDLFKCEHSPGLQTFAALDRWFVERPLRAMEFATTRGVGAFPLEVEASIGDKGWTLEDLLDFFDSNRYCVPAAFRAYFQSGALLREQPLSGGIYFYHNLWTVPFPKYTELAGLRGQERTAAIATNDAARLDYMHMFFLIDWLQQTGVISWDEREAWDRTIANNREGADLGYRFGLLGLLDRFGCLPEGAFKELLEHRWPYNMRTRLATGTALGVDIGQSFDVLRKGLVGGGHLLALPGPSDPSTPQPPQPSAISIFNGHTPDLRKSVEGQVIDLLRGMSPVGLEGQILNEIPRAGTHLDDLRRASGRLALHASGILGEAPSLGGRDRIAAMVREELRNADPRVPLLQVVGQRLLGVQLEWFAVRDKARAFLERVFQQIEGCRFSDRYLLPLGCKAHLMRSLDLSRLPHGSAFLRELFSQTGFRCIHAGATVNFPVVPSASELALLIVALQHSSELDFADAEYQFCLPGRLPQRDVALLGIAILLSSPQRVDYPDGAFRTTHATGSRIMLYDADGPRDERLGTQGIPRGRTDMLGRVCLEDGLTFQRVGTVLAQGSITPGPFGILAEGLRSDICRLLEDAGLTWVLNHSWVRDPMSHTEDPHAGTPEIHLEAIRACIAAAHDRGFISRMREMLSVLNQRIIEIQKKAAAKDKA